MIDVLESVGKPGNLRITVEVKPLEGGAPTEAFAYMKEPHLAVPAHSGWLEDYQDRRFIPPCPREA